MGNHSKEAKALDALAQALARKVRNAPPTRPRLRLVTTAAPTLYDSITRDCCLKRIRFLARAFRLQWLVEQAAFNTGGVDCLEDPELQALLTKLERARECIAEGISFEDADLFVDTSALLDSANP